MNIDTPAFRNLRYVVQYITNDGLLKEIRVDLAVLKFADLGACLASMFQDCFVIEIYRDFDRR